MSEFGEVVKTIFIKIGDFFDILDLSFIISGAAALGAVWFWADSFGMIWPPFLGGGITLLVLFIGSYWGGMICFAIGRWIRTILFRPQKNFKQNFSDILASHGLTQESPYKEYSARGSRGVECLYNRLWAELRESTELTSSMALCRRYWVMAATYDGVAFAALVWFATLVFWRFRFMPAPPPLWHHFALVEVILGLAVFFCLREANRYKIHQIEELVASLALRKKKPSGSGS